VLKFGNAEIHTIDPGLLCQHEPFEVHPKLYDEHKLSVRVRVYYDIRPKSPMKARSGFRTKWLSEGGHKMFLDGVLGNRMASVREVYEDVDHIDLLAYNDDELDEIINESFTLGLSIMVHIVGDGGLDQLLKVLERLKNHRIVNNWPVKITHPEMYHPDQIERIAESKAIWDIEPAQLWSDAADLRRIIREERLKHCFVLRSLIDPGVVVVEPINPLTGIQAAMVRCSSMNLAERISLTEALQMKVMTVIHYLKTRFTDNFNI
jgi:predicted amidohydrolase YtcJ